MKRLTSLISSLLIFVLCSAILFKPSIAHAATLNATGNIGWDETTCTGLMNGTAGGAWFGAVAGDAVNLTLSNTSTYGMSVQLYAKYTTTSFAPQSFTLTAGQSVSRTLPNVSGEYFVTALFQPTTSADPCEAKGSLAEFTILPGSATLYCDLVNNNSWHIYGTGGSVVPNISLYDDAALIQSPAVTTNFSTIATTIPAQSTPSTTSLYDGPDSNSRILASTTCPPIVASAPAATKSASTPNSGSVTNNTPASTSSIATSTTKDDANTPAGTPSKQQVIKTSSSISLKNTAAKAHETIAFSVLAGIAVMCVAAVVVVERTFNNPYGNLLHLAAQRLKIIGSKNKKTSR
ncbi:MAG TPA: hypothetical protein VMB52_02640 [Verrucomicrobiae bacterium]|nr:hypothetical protein [Verrucomicrobiae bacterium]